MNSITRKRFRIAAAVCFVVGLATAVAALPRKPSSEEVEKATAELAEWQARHHQDIIHGRESAAGPRPPGPPNPQISPLLVVLSFAVCMAGVAMFFMTLI